MSEKQKYPIEPGLYLARKNSFNWFHLVVEVGGEAPFLKLNWAVSRTQDMLVKVEIWDIVFGPKIEVPDVPKGDIFK